MIRRGDCGFAISTADERLIEDNARERYSKEYGDQATCHTLAKLELLEYDGTITPKGWKQLNRDTAALEKNAMQWLRNTFVWARDDGHDSHNDLVGAVGFDPKNAKHAELIDLASSSPGRSERIDMSDASYGDLALTVWAGVSDFGASVLDGAITFYDVDAGDRDAIEATLDAKRETDKAARKWATAKRTKVNR
jgi:hypothetical protein